MPFYEDSTSLRIPSGPAIVIKPMQIVVWVGIFPMGEPTPPDIQHRIPAVMDTGFNGAFLLREDHWYDWLRIPLDVDRFPYAGTLAVHGEKAPLFEGDVWLFSNVSGFRDQLQPIPTVRLETDGGIGLCSSDIHQLRLPLLGTSILYMVRLRLAVNGEHLTVNLRGPLE